MFHERTLNCKINSLNNVSRQVSPGSKHGAHVQRFSPDVCSVSFEIEQHLQGAPFKTGAIGGTQSARATESDQRKPDQ